MKKVGYNKAIIYDDNCPLCKAYTSAFVSTGFLQPENRISFSQITGNCLPKTQQPLRIDWQRAKHEIPVVDLNSGEVIYGVDALADILQHKIPFVKPLLKIPFIKGFFLELYKLVSYNRKIIVANNKPIKGEIDCSPDYSVKWRVALTVIAFLISALLIFKATSLLLYPLMTYTSFYLVGGVILLPCLLTIGATKKVAIDILAHAGITSIIVSFLLLIACLFQNIFSFPLHFFIVLTMLVAFVFIRQVITRSIFTYREYNC